jgi:hypothetical protein
MQRSDVADIRATPHRVMSARRPEAVIQSDSLDFRFAPPIRLTAKAECEHHGSQSRDPAPGHSGPDGHYLVRLVPEYDANRKYGNEATRECTA